MLTIKQLLTMVFGGVSLAMMLSTRLVAAVTPVPAPEFIPMVTPSINLLQPPGTDPPVLAERSFTLRQNEMRRVFGRVEITSSTSDGVYVETYTQCALQDGTMSQSTGAAQNHEGTDTPAGTSYPSQGHLVLNPLLLFKAPIAGTYRCWLSATSANDNRLTAVATDFNGTNTTWLQVSAGNDVGAFWWQNLDCDKNGNYGPATSTTPASWCLYLDGASNLQQVYVFDTDGTPPQVWQAASNAAFVDASDSLMLTTCYHNTDSCTSDNSEGWWAYYFGGRAHGTVVDSHLELIQLNSSGGVCNVTQSPEERSTVGSAPHHYMIYHSLSAVPVYPQCGSRLFKLRISVKYVSGDPVKEDGWLWTHAYAFTSYTSDTGTAPPVPSLIGLTEGVARNYLTATGYSASTVSYSLSTAPAGSVVNQFPSTVQVCPSTSCQPVGIIELPGSGVNLTVSSGGVIVPNLLSLPQSNATGKIKALGLVPSVSARHTCNDPGDVISQSPPSGTLVAPGSPVDITVDSGTHQTCIVK